MMKDKFIRIISPVTLAVVLVLDIAVAAYSGFAIQKLTHTRSAATIFFAAVEVLAIIVAILVTREVLKNGVIFRDDEFEFSGLDENNLFDYNTIVKAEAFKDEAPSLVKNFVDRHAVLTLTLKDDKVITIDIGLCKKQTLEKIQKEICTRCHIDYHPPAIPTKLNLKKKTNKPDAENTSAQTKEQDSDDAGI